MRIPLLAATIAATALAGCSTTGTDGRYRSYSRYDYNRVDPAYGGYYADRYYADGPRYRERRLSSRDRIYRGENGQYYCRRNDGTTGLIVGGLAGGVLGNIIAPGNSGLLGTLLGGAAGAAVGRSVDRNNVRCR
ncbi:MAG: glycine zipper 2TM domain-containing protein [Sphingomonas sp.]|jgi:outer membrane lipoprotein SlyB|uniref:glycine zipper 2TM domain-containing protein n=1 Tax=Sphingomonas sp. CD22 TaxID=3100214 RepID=UPI0011FBEB78|nr:glycine zipper 2TM domain-containing protein [Sphingomonas sp. CD22]MEA1086015.1 glycine zipper 2TM domain-containing protein [Sphingomonas sp. CD22]RZL51635.1 MAG: glycine zipper 2TM domain-containing protein [Sphingomonas sp.]